MNKKNKAIILGALMFGSVAVVQTAPLKPDRLVLAAGKPRYFSPGNSNSAVPSNALIASNPSAAASAALSQYGKAFGLLDPANQLKQNTMVSGASGSIGRYRQHFRGVPIIGAELVVAMDSAAGIRSISGEVDQTIAVPSIEPAITAVEARRIAASAVAKHFRTQTVSLSTTEPELSVFAAKLIGPDDGTPASLVWKMDVVGVSAPHVNEYVLVDAQSGAIRFELNQVESALSLRTYNANLSSVLPGTLLCDETNLACTTGSVSDADKAHAYAADTYNFYKNHHGRDSYDNAGATITSSVKYLYAGCPNAFWNGSQMAYCDGLSSADDVVAHELTHAVTSSTSKLFYYFQSGAINESLSDVWGEFVDLTNGAGTDRPEDRWLIGEDAPQRDVIRNMKNPPAFNQPDKMSSSLWYAGTQDNGGVHRNSGVNNKAVSLLVDGGSYNGYSVRGLGIDKVATIYYRVQTQHLTSGSDYADLHLALNQACKNLIGTSGITAEDCIQVANATDSVEMSKAPAVKIDAQAQLCGVNEVPNDIYFNGFETAANLQDWTVRTISGSSVSYAQFTGYAATGTKSLRVLGSTNISDTAVERAAGTTLPASARLHFRHSFDHEASGGVNYDGSLVEYSVDGGVTWTDASSLYSGGQNYTGRLDSTSGNPLGGRNAFSGVSQGFVSSRYNLSALAGQAVKFRFRTGTDTGTITTLPWVIDDFRIYTCAVDTSPNVSPVAAAGADATVAPEKPVLLDGSSSTDPDGFVASAQWTQISGPVANTTASGRQLSFTSPIVPVEDTLVFRLTVTDNRGATATDEVSVRVVNQQPVSNAGTDQSLKPRAVVSLSGAATDADGTIASYLWEQTAGPTVAMRTASAASSSFDAPSVPVSATLTFKLTATDNYGGKGVDTIDVKVTNDQPIVAASATSTVKAGGSVTVTGTASDPDGNIVSTSWQQVSGPAVTLSSTSGLSTTFTAPSASQESTLVFRLTATDNDGGTSTATVSVTAQAKSGGGSTGLLEICVLTALLLLRNFTFRRNKVSS